MWKQPVTVENRPGAGNKPSAVEVAKAAPDGHTLLVCSIATHGISPVIYKKLPYDHVKDFTPILRLANAPNALALHPSVPAKTVKEFVAYAKANPGKIQYGSTGVGQSGHLAMEMFRSHFGIDLVFATSAEVPPIDRIVAGRVQAAFVNLPGVPALAKEGKIRILAVSSPARHPQLPDVPTVAESGVPDFEVGVWSGICAPAATPKPILAKIAADAAKVLDMPETQRRFAQNGMDVAPLAPERFAAFIKADNARWAKAAKDAGLQPQ
jgi:tripartite-type tricarboxylate transporter receptor subunit TctC